MLETGIEVARTRKSSVRYPPQPDIHGGGALRPGNAIPPFLIGRYPQERRIVPAIYRRLRMISSVTFVPDVALRATVQDVETSSI